MWVIYGWYLDDMWVIFGWYVKYMDDMWVIYGWYLDDITYTLTIAYSIYVILYKLTVLTITRLSKWNFYLSKIKNLLTLILMKTSIYSKMIEILKHCIYQNSSIKFLTYINSFETSSNIIKFSLKNAFLCIWGFMNILTQKLEFKKSSLCQVYSPRFHRDGTGV